MQSIAFRSKIWVERSSIRLSFCNRARVRLGDSPACAASKRISSSISLGSISTFSISAIRSSMKCSAKVWRVDSKLFCHRCASRARISASPNPDRRISITRWDKATRACRLITPSGRSHSFTLTSFSMTCFLAELRCSYSNRRSKARRTAPRISSAVSQPKRSRNGRVSSGNCNDLTSLTSNTASSSLPRSSSFIAS